MKAQSLLPIVLALASGVSAQATVWNAGADLVANEVPDGPQELDSANPTVPEWSYGYRFTLESTGLTPFSGSDHISVGAGSAFQGFQFDTTTIAVNTTASPQVWPGLAPTFVNDAGEMFLHPGALNEIAIIRWTAPAAGTYQLDSQWRKLDSALGDGVVAAIVINGSAVYNQGFGGGIGGGAGATATDSRSLVLNPGDTVDFALGPYGNYLSDSTAFNATISNVPEPSSALLLALGGVAMLQRWRRVAKARA